MTAVTKKIVTIALPAVMLPVFATTALAADKLEIDGVHSSVVFRVMHMGITPFYGRFNDISGTVDFNREAPKESKFSVIIKTDSVDTNNKGRDQHLKSPDFFNAAEFPELKFVSKSVEVIEENKLKVTGELTLHGKTREIAVTIDKTGEGAGPQGDYRVGFESRFTIKQSEFGMGEAASGRDDEVNIMIGLETIRK